MPGVASVPQGVAKAPAWAGGGVDHLDGDASGAEGTRRLLLPVGLRQLPEVAHTDGLGESECVCVCVRVSRRTHLFPHHHVEASAGLVGKHQPCVIIISICVHVERCTEVYRVELIKAYTHTHGQTQAKTWRETHIDTDTTHITLYAITVPQV